MSKSLRSYENSVERGGAVARRLRNSSKDVETGKLFGGLGYWAARDSEKFTTKGAPHASV